MPRLPRAKRRAVPSSVTARPPYDVRRGASPDEGESRPAPGWSEPDVEGVARREVSASVPYELQVTAGYAWRLIVIGVALWGLLRLLAATTTVVIPLAVAVLLTALLMPVMVLLNHRWGLPRHGAAAITVLGFLALVIGLLSLAGSQLVGQVGELVGKADVGIDRIMDWLRDGPLHLGGDQVSRYIDSGRTWVTEHQGSLSSGALRASGTATEFFAGTLIALISTFFFLAEGDRIWSWMVRLLPGRLQEKVHEGFRRGFVSLGSYAKTQCVVAAVDSVFITAGAFLLGLPLLIPMGLIIFFGSFIPIIGAVISASIAVLVALVVKGPVAALTMLGIILLVQQIEGHVLQPVLMSKAVALHPLAVILGVGLGSFLLGIVGALFAVPFLAVVNTTVLYWAGHDKFPGLAHGMSAVSTSAKRLAGEKNGDDEVDDVEKEDERRTRRIGDASPAMARAHQDRLDEAARG